MALHLLRVLNEERSLHLLWLQTGHVLSNSGRLEQIMAVIIDAGPIAQQFIFAGHRGTTLQIFNHDISLGIGLHLGVEVEPVHLGEHMTFVMPVVNAADTVGLLLALLFDGGVVI